MCIIVFALENPTTPLPNTTARQHVAQHHAPRASSAFIMKYRERCCYNGLNLFWRPCRLSAKLTKPDFALIHRPSCKVCVEKETCAI